MLGCSLNLFMMLSIWSSIFYFANGREFLEFIYDVEYMVLFFYLANARVFLQFIYDVADVVIFFNFANASVFLEFIYDVKYMDPLSFILQMLGCSFNLFMMLSIWPSFVNFANARMLLEFIYDVEYMEHFLLFCKC